MPTWQGRSCAELGWDSAYHGSSQVCGRSEGNASVLGARRNETKMMTPQHVWRPRLNLPSLLFWRWTKLDEGWRRIHNHLKCCRLQIFDATNYHLRQNVRCNYTYNLGVCCSGRVSFQRFSLPAQLQLFPGSSLDFGHSNGLVDPLVPYLYPLYNWTSNRIN